MQNSKIHKPKPYGILVLGTHKSNFLKSLFLIYAYSQNIQLLPLDMLIFGQKSNRRINWIDAKCCPKYSGPKLPIIQFLAQHTVVLWLICRHREKGNSTYMKVILTKNLTFISFLKSFFNLKAYCIVILLSLLFTIKSFNFRKCLDPWDFFSIFST